MPGVCVVRLCQQVQYYCSCLLPCRQRASASWQGMMHRVCAQLRKQDLKANKAQILHGDTIRSELYRQAERQIRCVTFLSVSVSPFCLSIYIFFCDTSEAKQFFFPPAAGFISVREHKRQSWQRWLLLSVLRAPPPRLLWASPQRIQIRKPAHPPRLHPDSRSTNLACCSSQQQNTLGSRAPTRCRLSSSRPLESYGGRDEMYSTWGAATLYLR